MSHYTWKYVGYFQLSFDMISNIISQWKENLLSKISVPLDHEIFAPCFMSMDTL